MSLTPEREAQIRALPVKTEPERDLLEALDEARAERDKYKRTAEVNATCLAGAMRGMDLYSPPPAPLRWTSEPPTSSGWYWLRDDHSPCRIAEVVQRPTHLVVLDPTDDGMWRMDKGLHPSMEWAGPIVPPPIPAPASPADEAGEENDR